jgi:hypothetical protein
MVKKDKKTSLIKSGTALTGYNTVLSEITELLEQSRQASVRAVNTIMTATYWEIGRRIVEFEQKGKRRAQYGEQLINQLSIDLKKRFGRGFGKLTSSPALKCGDSPV